MFKWSWVDDLFEILEIFSTSVVFNMDEYLVNLKGGEIRCCGEGVI